MPQVARKQGRPPHEFRGAAVPAATTRDSLSRFSATFDSRQCASSVSAWVQARGNGCSARVKTTRCEKHKYERRHVAPQSFPVVATQRRATSGMLSARVVSCNEDIGCAFLTRAPRNSRSAKRLRFCKKLDQACGGLDAFDALSVLVTEAAIGRRMMIGLRALLRQ